MAGLVGRSLDIRPDPLRIARAVASLPGAALLWSADGSGASYVMAEPCDMARSLDPEPSLPLQPNARQLARVPRWVGVLPYECRRTLERPAFSPVERREAPQLRQPLWLRYGACAVIRDRVVVVGDVPEAVAALSRALLRAGRGSTVRVKSIGWRDDVKGHAERVRAARERILAGDIYQVNLARRLDLEVSGRPVDLLTALGRSTRVPYAAALSLPGLDVVSTSPELFLSLRSSGTAWTLPIKGTRPRGSDSAEDERLTQELDSDPKERAELAMVVDVERNDLGRVAVPGSVRVVGKPRIRTYGTVHHRIAAVRATVQRDITRTALLQSMLPSGSVTGAPKVRAMEIIAELENDRRGLYTGALGFLRHDGGLELSMAIRTLTVQDGVGHYFAGGGIVADSDPDAEARETAWKAEQVRRLLTSVG